MKKILFMLASCAIIIAGIIIFNIMTDAKKEQATPENMTDSLTLDGAKYILAFSEANASRENKGAFFTIDQQGNYLSRSAEMNISDPIAFKQADKDAYLVNNSSSDRYTVDLTTGKIQSLKATHQKNAQSFTLHTNGEYVIYDVAADYTKPQQLVYWKRTNAHGKKIVTIPNGFAQSIYIHHDIAYISTSNPDATQYIHQINLKTGELMQTKKLTLKAEEYTQSALPSNQSMIMFHGKLYVAVTKTHVIPATKDYQSDVYEFNGSLLQLNPKTLKIEKKIAIKDKNFNPDTLAVVQNKLVILDTFEKAYVMNKTTKITPMKFKIDEQMKNELAQMDTNSDQITVINQTAYIFTQYVKNEKTRGEINAYNLKTGQHLSRTIIPYPAKDYYIMTFAVIE